MKKIIFDLGRPNFGVAPQLFAAHQAAIFRLNPDDSVHEYRASDRLKVSTTANWPPARADFAQGVLLLGLMELSKSIAARPWWIQSTVDARSRRDAVTSGSAVSANARVAWLLAMLIAALHAFMAVTAVNTKSPTFDEPQHLTAGFSYWKNDFRLDPENGNLAARWAALPLLFTNTQFVSPDDSNWRRADEGGTAHRFFYDLGNDPDRMIAQARLAMSIFGIALCLLIYRITREFFGIVGALVAETLIAFDPNFLAHSALVTSDVPAAFFFAAAIWSNGRLFQRISPLRFAIAALSLSGLFLTKFSAPIVLPALLFVSILQIASTSEIALWLGRIRINLTETLHKGWALVATWVLLAMAIFFAIWLAYSFRYAAWTDDVRGHEDGAWHWSYVLEDRGTLENAVSFARTHHLLPEAYLYGVAYVNKHEGDRPAFLDNRWSLIGFSSFFPLAFAYKTPIPLLCFIVVALGVMIARRKTWQLKKLLNPFAIFVAIYAAFAVGTQLNIGHRHILPIYPALFVACGAIALLLKNSRKTFFAGVIAVLLCWQVGESLAARPNYLAYFNQIAGGPRNGYHHLVDSSLDWGQDLPALKSWLDDHHPSTNPKPVYLAYFGVADPKSYGIEAKRLPENHSGGDQTFGQLSSGTYCVSATALQSVYAREIGPWCQGYEQQYQTTLADVHRYRATASDSSARVALIVNDGASAWARRIRTFERLRFERLCAFLRHRSPDAQIGYSIFVFEVSDPEVNRALYGRPRELIDHSGVIGY
jgi:hypothetical protein